MKRKLKIAFCCSGHRRMKWLQGYRIFQLLGREYDLEISDDPELLFFNERGQLKTEIEYDCHKVFFTGECIKPDFKVCDYAFSFEDTDERNFQFPNFARYPFFRELHPQDHQDLFFDHRFEYSSSDELKKYREADKSRFCGFLYSNHRAKERIEFCKKLMLYKQVDCPGKVLNNMPPFDNKFGGDKRLTSRARHNFTKRYKFTIAFENQSVVNYTTEKICIPFVVGSLPIYWGNPKVSEYFNPEAFINCHDYDDFDQVIKRVIEVDNDDDLYRQYINAPAIVEGSKLCAITDESIVERLHEIVGSIGVTVPVSRKVRGKLRWFFYTVSELKSKLQLKTGLKKWIKLCLNRFTA